MGKLAYAVTTVIGGLLLSCSGVKTTDAIKMNSLGFGADAVKKASVIKNKSVPFQVKRTSDKSVVYEGVLSEPVFQEDVSETVCVADFSEMKDTGDFYIEIDGIGKSNVFEVSNTVYDSLYVAAMRAFYLWRCGMSVECDFCGEHYSTEACHLDDGRLDYVGVPGGRRDGTGGWHDAGDYGKYTVNAGITLGTLFYAWEHFGDKLNRFDLDIPETSDMPYFLQELKWETDFILKMQYSDGTGRVSHKLTRIEFSGLVMPSDDDGTRYFSDWSTASVADFIAIMSMASRCFKPYDAEYSAKCLDAARVSYDFLITEPREKTFEQGDFKTGGYITEGDDCRIWAAAEMWETTGEERFLDDLERLIVNGNVYADVVWDWTDVENLGLYTYVLSEREGRDFDLFNDIKNSIIKSADSIVENINTDVYGRSIGNVYSWGSNGTVARVSLNLQVANKISPNEKYDDACQAVVDHLLGRNYYGRSYVTGFGINPPMNPHDRRSMADSIVAPWPGYIVGGGHTATDWVDDASSYSHNEIAINWQAGLVYALAAVLY